MKRIIKSIIIVCIIFVTFLTYRGYAQVSNKAQDSKEEQYKYIINSLLLPYIQKSVENYYSVLLTDTPLVDPWDINIMSVERPNNFFVFVMKLKVKPYVGSHLNVGEDNITISVQGTGEVHVESFEHIKSSYWDLPPNYQKIIKKPKG